MRGLRDWLGVVLLAVATLYGAYLAREWQEQPAAVKRGERPYLDLIYFDLFSLIGAWLSVAVLGLLTLALVALILRRRRAQALDAAPPLPIAVVPQAVLPQPREQGPLPPTVSPDRIARVVGAWGLPASLRPEAPADTSPAERLLANALAEVQRGRGVQAAAPVRKAPSLRLVPRVPVRDAAAAPAWLGGGARLPEGLAWPEIDGEPLQLLAQVDCTCLPLDLWGGIGPREGWLAMFLAPRSLRPRVIYFTQPGPFRPSPVVLKDANMVHPDMWKSESALRAPAVPTLPRWPVDVLVVEDGQEEPRRAGRAYNIGSLDRLDIAERRFQPFDWPSLEMMLQLALNCSQACVQDNEEATANELAAVDKLRDLGAAVAILAQTQPFSPDMAAVILAETRLMPAFMPRNPPAPDPAAPVPEQAPPDPTDWQVPYVRFLQDRAKHIHSAGTGPLPAALLDHCVEVWREWAAHEMAAMGHLPWARPPSFEETEEVVLLELPSSHLMNWHFGNAGNLVMTIRRKDLELGDFDHVAVHVRH